MGGAWFAYEKGGKWGCGGVWKDKWVMWTMRFNETWWTQGHGTFCAHEVRNLLRVQLKIGPTFLKLLISTWQF
jgi:hypothetical protein